MTDPNYRRERLPNGWIDLFRDEETGAWRISWHPDEGKQGYPAERTTPPIRTYLPTTPAPMTREPSSSGVASVGVATRHDVWAQNGQPEPRNHRP
jgi:hypothetical protein